MLLSFIVNVAAVMGLKIPEAETVGSVGPGGSG